MKKEINAALILVSFPLLWIGGNLANTALSSIGILLLTANACFIIAQRKPAGSKKK